MPQRSIKEILDTPFPAEYRHGADNAVNVCLRLQDGERFVLITDEQTLPIAASIAEAVHALGNKFGVFVLEDFGLRPMTEMPPPILHALEETDVSIYACNTQTGELQHRIEMMRVINRRHIRHGHMVNINHQIMMEGMRADFHEVDEISTRLIEKARKARTLHATTQRGTDIRVEFSPDLNWLKTSGFITRDKWGNLPGGEIFTSPARVDGLFVVDGVVGDYLCEKYGDLQDAPLFIQIENSRIVHCDSENKALLNDFVRYCMTDENSNRVGEFAIGTNIALTRLIGHILQDEKFPGVHIAFGHPYSEHTGADWTSTTHIDVVGRDFNIWIEDEQIMREGTFTF